MLSYSSKYERDSKNNGGVALLPNTRNYLLLLLEIIHAHPCSLPSILMLTCRWFGIRALWLGRTFKGHHVWQTYKRRIHGGWWVRSHHRPLLREVAAAPWNDEDRIREKESRKQACIHGGILGTVLRGNNGREVMLWGLRLAARVSTCGLKPRST